MSPPIRDGSGSSIGSIRLGDGSEIAEVRTGAGDVLFSAIPDTGLLHDFIAEPLSFSAGTTADPWDDQQTTEQLTASNSPTYRENEVNGEAAIELRATDNDLYDSSVSVTLPLVCFLVYQTVNTSSVQRIISQGPTASFFLIQDRQSGDEYNVDIGQGGTLAGSTTANQFKIVTVIAETGRVRLRENQASQIDDSSFTGGNDLTNMSVAYRADNGPGSEQSDIDLARIRFHDFSNLSLSDVADIENGLNSIYNVY